MIKDQIDKLRAWAILGVVIIHVTSYFINVSEFSWLPVTLAGLDIYAHFAVPLFVLLSGLVLGMKYTGNFSIKEFYNKRINKILIPYFIWSAVYIGFSTYKGLINIIFKLLSGSGAYHLWFFFLIVQLYFLFPFIRKLLKNHSIYFIFMILMLQIAYSELLLTEFEGKYVSLFLERLFLSYLFYFCFGIWIADNINKTENFLSKISLSVQVVILLVCILISYKFSYSWLAHYNDSLGMYKGSRFIENIVLPFVFLLIFINITYISAMIKSVRISNLLLLLSKYSFGIYLSHVLILKLLFHILKKVSISQDNISFYPITFIGTMALSVFFCFIVEKTILSKYMLGINQVRKIT